MKKFRILSIILFLFSLAGFLGYHFYFEARVDHVAPVILVPEKTLRVKVNVKDKRLLKGITASDDRDGDLTDQVFVESIGPFHDDHKRTVTYAVMDKAGNVAKATREIKYRNYHGPRFGLTSPMQVPYTGSAEDIISYVQAEDQVDGDISGSVKVSGRYRLGRENSEYPMEFMVSNSLGDTAKIKMTVEVPAVEAILNGTGKLELSEYLVYVDHKTGKLIPTMFSNEENHVDGDEDRDSEDEDQNQDSEDQDQNQDSEDEGQDGEDQDGDVYSDGSGAESEEGMTGENDGEEESEHDFISDFDSWRYLTRLVIGSKSYTRVGDYLIPDSELVEYERSIEEVGYGNTDNGIPREAIRIDNPVNTRKKGTYEIKYSYTDEDQDISALVRLVVVVE